MKRILYIAIMICLFLFGATLGIDKSKKDTKRTDSTRAVVKNKIKKNSKETVKGRKFDNFIDKDNNGIDDRAEKNKPKDTKKKKSDEDK